VWRSADQVFPAEGRGLVEGCREQGAEGVEDSQGLKVTSLMGLDHDSVQRGGRHAKPIRSWTAEAARRGRRLVDVEVTDIACHGVSLHARNFNF
jgi:hypothetical protein